MKPFRTTGLGLWVAAGLAALLVFVWRFWLGFNMTLMLEYPGWKTPDQPRHDVSSRIDLDAPGLTHVLLHDGPRG